MPLRLYLIEILHQTTTGCSDCEQVRRCILSKFYIKPQRFGSGITTGFRCILSKFYIKPQLRLERELACCSCILSKFYIKPQRVAGKGYSRTGCILSKFYIKPQLRRRRKCYHVVVSYRNSTSNHNVVPIIIFAEPVVSYRNSTSNHNCD